MRFFLDHDVPEDIARVLRQADHEVTNVMDVLEPTATDPEFFDYASRHGLILITCTRYDFL